MKLTDKQPSATHRVLSRGKVIQTLHNLSKCAGVYVDQETLITYGKYAAYIDDQQRVVVCLGKRDESIFLHRLITNCPADKVVDHINGNPTDNRLENLRIATKSQNQWNRKASCNNKLNLKGVAFHKASNKFRARINVQGKEIYLGVFETAQQAAHEYNKAAVKYHGDFAALNPI